jgi:hypothetical protein
VTDYLTQVSLYNLDKNAGEDVFQGATPNQTELKSAYNIGNYDISKNSDGTYTLGAPNDGSGFSTGSSNSLNYASKNIARIKTNPYKPSYFTRNPKLYVKRHGSVKVAKAGKPKTLKVTAVKGTL